MKGLRNNYKIYVDGWSCYATESLADAIRIASEWVRMGHKDVTIRELVSGIEWNHDTKRVDRF